MIVGHMEYREVGSGDGDEVVMVAGHMEYREVGSDGCRSYII